MTSSKFGDLKFEVLVGEFVMDSESYGPGEHELKNANSELHRLAAHAAAGDPWAVKILAGGDDSDIQSQEDGEKALAEAMGTHHVENNPDGTRTSYWDGPWFEGHMEQAALDEVARSAGQATLAIEADAPEEE